MNKLKMLSVVVSGFLTISGMSVSFADAIPSDLINQCTSIINLSDSDFNATYSNPTQAASAATLLDSCNSYNICSEIDNVANCSSTLSTRDFLSNYYALLGGSFHSALPPAPVNNPQTTHNEAAPAQAPTANNAISVNSNVNTTDNDSKNKQKDINWF